MQTKRHRLSNQILGIAQTPKRQALQPLNHELLIQHQQQVIACLRNQLKYLREYVRYFCRDGQTADQQNSISPSNQQTDPKKTQTPPASPSPLPSSLKTLLREIMQLTQSENIDSIPLKLKSLLEKANKKQEPVFVERIKIKEVPVPVEVIREVEKEVIRYQERIVEVPIFREKIVERYVQRPADGGLGSPKCADTLTININAALGSNNINSPQNTTTTESSLPQSPTNLNLTVNTSIISTTTSASSQSSSNSIPQQKQPQLQPQSPSQPVQQSSQRPNSPTMASTTFSSLINYKEQPLQSQDFKKKFNITVSQSQSPRAGSYAQGNNYQYNGGYYGGGNSGGSGYYNYEDNRNYEKGYNGQSRGQHNQTFTAKSPRFKEKDRQRDDYNNNNNRDKDRGDNNGRNNFYKSPRYKQKDHY